MRRELAKRRESTAPGEIKAVVKQARRNMVNAAKACLLRLL
jgi:hypothetical protein